MVTAFQAIRAAQNAVACPLLGANAYVLGSLGGFVPGLNRPALAAIRGLRRLYGCPEAGDVEDDDLDALAPFEGGQCDGILYEFQVRATRANGSTQLGVAKRARGPLDIRARATSFSAAGEPTNYTIEILTTQLFTVGSSAPPIGARIWRFESTISANPTGSVSTATFENLARTDNQPDDCGSLDPVLPPPTTFDIDLDVTYNIDNGDEVTVTIPFIYAPITANFDGTLRIPFTFDFGGFEYSGDINLLPDLTVSINPPSLPPGSGDDVSGQGEDNPEETTPPAPPGEKIIGVVVTATNTQSQQVTSYSTPGLTPIFVPRLGSVKFVYSIGSATFFSSDIDIKDRRTFIPCPFSQGADAVIASPNEGVTITSTPIRGFPLATTKDTTATT